jgi:hypothetical protein
MKAERTNMTGKRLAAVVGVVAMIAVVGVLLVGTAFAQSGTPGAQATPTTPKDHAFGFGKGLGFMGGGSMADFDAMAKALNLTPTELFEQLHGGKTLAEIAQAKGVDLTKIQEAANATRIQAMKDRIAQSVTDGKMTQAQADWMLQGLEKGYTGKGMGGFRGGPMMGRGGMHGFGGQAPSQKPSRTAPGTTS